MKRRISTHEAKTHLSKIIQEVCAGAEVIICRGNVPMAKIVAYEQSGVSQKRPRVGTPTSGKIAYAKDVFAPLSDPDELSSWGLS